MFRLNFTTSFFTSSPQFIAPYMVCHQLYWLLRVFSFYFPRPDSYPMTNNYSHAPTVPRYSGNDGVRGRASAVRGGRKS